MKYKKQSKVFNVDTHLTSKMKKKKKKNAFLERLKKTQLNFLGRGKGEFFILDLSTVLTGFLLSYLLFVSTYTYKLIPPQLMGAAVVVYFILFLGPNMFFRDKKESEYIKTFVGLGLIWALFVPVSPLFLNAVLTMPALSFWFFIVYFIHVPVFLTIFHYLKTDGFFILVFYAWLVEDAWVGRVVLKDPLSLGVLAYTIFVWLFQYYPIYVLTNWITNQKQSINRTIFDLGVVTTSVLLTGRLIWLQMENSLIDSFLAGMQITVLVVLLALAVYLKNKERQKEERAKRLTKRKTKKVKPRKVKRKTVKRKTSRRKKR
ncbi:MAG: hypothetical protein GOV15_03910 [Candidatus Diapherotrites archaeon]|nr:hypothetical protein [Candidatus Diapherotrites archaeon]